MNELISLIIPNFNSGLFLKEMIDSIIAQSYENWELIIVDDGSTDETPKMIEEYSKTDKRIRLIHRTIGVKGAQTCRNIGFDNSKGEYVIFFDADDWCPPYCLKQRIDFMKTNPDVDFAVFPTVSFHNPKTKEWLYCNGYKREKDALGDLVSFISLPFGVWSNIYKSSSLRKKNISWDVNVKNMQDSDFNIECIVNGLNFKLSNDKPSYYYRDSWNPNSVGQSVNQQYKFDSRLYVLSKRIRQFESSEKLWENVLILSYFFFFIENNNGNEENLKILLKQRPYIDYLLLGKRLLLVNLLSKKLSIKGKWFNLLSFLFAPSYTLRYKIYQKKKNIDALKLYSEYERKMKTTPIKYTIDE